MTLLGTPSGHVAFGGLICFNQVNFFLRGDEIWSGRCCKIIEITVDRMITFVDMEVAVRFGIFLKGVFYALFESAGFSKRGILDPVNVQEQEEWG
ncbi:hypothetical protein AVEN_221257-1 [Araneus ventricosus]|uniref:Uncharacterized protein n=1 Tax=Araneus ventricosus TaxID=182803 RepID=A0A4Y2LW28_ARAVE|nr:hypothetical protein AVEN_221257-1 [Araneus ventricosus]